MTTSHQLAAMSDEQFETHLLRQAIEAQAQAMRREADFMVQAGEAAAALVLRRHADQLDAALGHNMTTS